jgi:hypothetical protein
VRSSSQLGIGGDGIQSRLTGALLQRFPSVGAKRESPGLSAHGSTPAGPVEDESAISSTPGPPSMLLLLF